MNLSAEVVQRFHFVTELEKIIESILYRSYQ